MTKSKVEEFHISFINNLAFLALVTVVSMVSVRFLITHSFSRDIPTPVYTSSESQIKPD